MPMILRFSAKALSINASILDGSPISSSIFITLVLAPPCNGPASAAIPAVTAPYIPASVPATTRVVNVEALSS